MQVHVQNHAETTIILGGLKVYVSLSKEIDMYIILCTKYSKA